MEPEFQWIWRAWHRLNADRPFWGGGMSAPVPGSISYADMVVWAREHEMSNRERLMLDQCFMAMDEVYRGWWVAKNAPESR